MLQSDSLADLERRLSELEKRACDKLLSRGFLQDQLSAQRFLNMRFKGTDVALMVTHEQIDGYKSTFLDMYQREFGFVLQDRDIIVDDVRCATIVSARLPQNVLVSLFALILESVYLLRDRRCD